jgi:ornithine decarboxylase
MSPSEIATWGIPKISPYTTTVTSSTNIQPWCPSVMAPAALGTSPVPTKLSPQQRRFSQASASTKLLAQSMISHALQFHIENIDPDKCEAGGEDAFFVADLGEIYRQHMRWKVNLPRIEPFYGMLCPL